MEQTTTGSLQSNQEAYQHCFIGHSQEAPWRPTFAQVCEEVLPQFGLQPWYADKHYQGSIPLREKVVNMIATTRYGIYDLSYWRKNDRSAWLMPRNVLIELGMAIALNRPMLLLRHGNNRECGLKLPACLEGIEIGEFSDGKKLLKQTLQARLSSLTQRPPQEDWLHRFCRFGGLECSFREVHPQARQWGRQKLHLHISTGTQSAHSRSDFRETIQEELISRFSNLEISYLDDLNCPSDRKFLLCSHCQQVRSSPFAIYRITSNTPADTFIAIGMSLALEKQSGYAIPKILIAQNEDTLPSLLKGYEIVIERDYSRVENQLNTILPEIIEEVKQTRWKPQPLPFEVFLPEKEISATSIIAEQEEGSAIVEGSTSEADSDISPVIEETTTDSTPEKLPSQPARFLIHSARRKGSQEYQLDKEEIRIGRAPTSDIVLSEDKMVSRHHATVRYENRQYVLYDEKSIDGVFVNRQRILPLTPVVLRDGDQVGIGEYELIFSTSASPAIDIGNAPTISKAINIFISYAHEDRRYLDQLRKHLLPLQMQGWIKIWDDSDIYAGVNVEREVEEQMQRANVILLLISASFLASEFCYGKEMRWAMEKHALGTATVIPILLRSCDWRETPFGGIQGLPRDGQPISSRPDRDRAFFEIAQEIRRVIEELQNKRDKL